MTLEQRLTRLENENRWMRRVGSAGIATLAAVLLAGQGVREDLRDLEVRSLTVRDKDGRARITLTTSGEIGSAVAQSADITLYDDQGTRLAILGVSRSVVPADDARSATLRLLSGGGGNVRIGAGSGGASMIFSADNRPMIALSHYDAGGEVVVHDEKGAKRAVVAKEGVTLFNSDRTVAWRTPEK